MGTTLSSLQPSDLLLEDFSYSRDEFISSLMSNDKHAQNLNLQCRRIKSPPIESSPVPCADCSDTSPNDTSVSPSQIQPQPLSQPLTSPPSPPSPPSFANFHSDAETGQNLSNTQTPSHKSKGKVDRLRKELEKVKEKLRIISDLELKMFEGKRLFHHETQLVSKRQQFESEVDELELLITTEAAKMARKMAASSGDASIFIPASEQLQGANSSSNQNGTPIPFDEEDEEEKCIPSELSYYASVNANSAISNRKNRKVTMNTPSVPLSSNVGPSEYWSKVHSSFHGAKVDLEEYILTMPSGSIQSTFCDHNVNSPWNLCWDYLTNPAGCSAGDDCPWSHPVCPE